MRTVKQIVCEVRGHERPGSVYRIDMGGGESPCYEAPCTRCGDLGAGNYTMLGPITLKPETGQLNELLNRLGKL